MKKTSPLFICNAGSLVFYHCQNTLICAINYQLKRQKLGCKIDINFQKFDEVCAFYLLLQFCTQIFTYKVKAVY